MIDPISFILKFIFDFWWLILPILISQITWEKFVENQKAEFRKKVSWSFFELKFPTNITKTPRAMEEVLNALHAIAPDPKKDLTWYNLNILGFMPKNYTLLIIAHDGKLKFYIRFPSELKEFIKTRFYSQYPDTQFVETGNPLENLPPNLPNSLFDFVAFSVKLKKDDAYPIKTYSFIEKLPKEQQIDPISTFSEGASQISNKEWLIFQIFATPTTADNKIIGKNWTERGQKIVNKLIGKEEKKEAGILDSIKEFMINLFWAPIRYPVWKTTKKEGKEFNIQKLTPGEMEVIEMVQKKLSKLGYWCSIRVSYIAEKKTFQINQENVFALISSIFKVFSTENLNSFSIVKLIKPSEKETLQTFLMKRLQNSSFRKFKPTSNNFILNSEELATIFHPPMEFISRSSIEKVTIKEVPPPEIPYLK